MLSERRHDELVRMSKEELIALLLETERQRNAAQHGLDMLHNREPGRYAFYCRHLALSYVRKVNPELHQEVFSRACRVIDEQGGKSYQDVVAGLEALAGDALSLLRSFLSEYNRSNRLGFRISETEQIRTLLERGVGAGVLPEPAPVAGE